MILRLVGVVGVDVEPPLLTGLLVALLVAGQVAQLMCNLDPGFTPLCQMMSTLPRMTSIYLPALTLLVTLAGSLARVPGAVAMHRLFLLHLHHLLVLLSP